MGSPLKIGLCQIRIAGEKQANISKAIHMVREAAEEGCSLVVLPELFNCPLEPELFHSFAESYPGGETLEALSGAASDERVVLVGGSIPETDGKGSLYNASFIFDERGMLLGRHRKVHLFDVDIKGGITFKESDTISAGNEITVVRTDFATLGVAICYDVRFPEFSRAMVMRGAEILVFPAAFNSTTGPAHWEILMRARAVDNQVYVLAASPAAGGKSSYKYYGHSMAVDPWGSVLTEAGAEETLVICEIDIERVYKVRRELPLLRHMRRKIYEGASDASEQRRFY
ncbi:MAG: carbon-nitrogen hydrolase family protein [Candidatus Eremiobacteraeota bacterium]|nr:carbon-nitrogen hydrolase family protein [Candidatus Eremiobacteraeota bacterium]